LKQSKICGMKENEKDLLALFSIPFLAIMARDFINQGEGIIAIGMIAALILIYIRLIRSYNGR
jgi:hypothetical protein